MEAELQTYQEVYQHLLQAQDLQPLTRFKSQRTNTIIFPEAQIYPDFFNNNLMTPGRVIKYFKGKSAFVRAFNYQLMRLTFEIQFNDVDYVEVLKSVVFHPGLLREDDEMQSPISGRGCTDRQYKRIIADFIELMATQAIPNFQFTLMEYPIVDEALTYAIEAITARCYSGELKTQDMVNWLCQTFAMTVEKHGKCYKFQEADMFLYEDNEQEYYIAFLNEMAEMSDYSDTTHRVDDKRSLNAPISSHQRQLKGSSPDFTAPLDEDIEFRNATDKYRNSAQPHGWKNKRIDSPSSIVRKTCSNEFMKEIKIKEIDESLEKDKPSDQSKPEDHSKIGSLLDIMSQRSSKDLSLHHKSPEVSSSRQFSEEEIKPLTSRTLQNQPKILISQELKEVQEERQLYASGESDRIETPQFTNNAYISNPANQTYNPFTKKYSEQYMQNLYEKSMPPNTDIYKFNIISQTQAYKFSSEFPGQYQSDVPSDFESFKPKPSYTFDTSQKYNYSSKPSYGYDNQSELPGKSQGYKAFLADSMKNLDQKESLFKRQGVIPNVKDEQPGSFLYKKTPIYQDFMISKYEVQQNCRRGQSYSSYNDQDEDLLYRPQQKHKFAGSKAAAVSLDFLNDGVEDSKGTIYRQFTDTRVLEVMPSFERRKTDVIRQRFKGIHRRDLYKGH